MAKMLAYFLISSTLLGVGIVVAFEGYASIAVVLVYFGGPAFAKYIKEGVKVVRIQEEAAKHTPTS